MDGHRKESILVQAYPSSADLYTRHDRREAERKVIQEHATYWKRLIDDGIAIIFGLVLDPRGPWGVGIVDVANESDAHALGTNDPAVKAGWSYIRRLSNAGAVVRK